MAVPHLRLIVGEFGSGKSLFLLEHGLELAEKFHKGLIANFPINLAAVRAYCRLKNYRWLLSVLGSGSYSPAFRYHPTVDNQSCYSILDYSNRVILFDEAGIFLNSRNWSKTPQSFLASLVQVRKDGNIFLLACHFIDQIDKQVRENIQYFYECRGVSVLTRSGLPRLLFRWRYEFKPAAYHRWLEDVQGQSNFFKTSLRATKRVSPSLVFPWRLLLRPSPYGLFFYEICLSDSPVSLLFKAFDSGHRLDKKREGRKYMLSQKAVTTSV